MRTFFLTSGLFLLVILPNSGFTPVANQSNDNRGFTVKPYVQWITQSGISILWESKTQVKARVEYAEARPGGDTSHLELTKESNSRSHFHKIRLEGLRPATKYFYKVVLVFEDGSEIKSEAKPFQTAIIKGGFTFGVLGDTQIHHHDPDAWRRVASQIWKHRPNLVLHAGDLVSSGKIKEQWINDFLGKAQPLMGTVPIFSVLGNHEDDSKYYYQYMENPAPEYYYTFTYGNTQFFMLDSNRDCDPDSEQYLWLEKELARSPAVWKIVVHHHPPYSSDENDFGDTHIRKAEEGHGFVQSLIGLYEKYSVDMVFYGHIHSYERTWNIKDGIPSARNGVIYVQTGGGGGELEKAAPTRSWFTAKVKTDHHYCMVSVIEDELKLEAFDEKGNLFDQHTVRKMPGHYKNIIAGKAVSPPILRTRNTLHSFLDRTFVNISHPDPEVTLHYTLDGSEPTSHSPVFQKDLLITGTTTVKAKSFKQGLTHDESAALSVKKVSPIRSLQPASLEKGLRYRYYQDTIHILPIPENSSVDKEGITSQLSNEGINETKNYYAMDFAGYLYIDSTAVYKFYSLSGDGTRLFLNDQLVLDNNGSHQPIYQFSEVPLEKGYYKLFLDYFQDRGLQHLEIGYTLPTGVRQALKKEALFH